MRILILIFMVLPFAMHSQSSWTSLANDLVADDLKEMDARPSQFHTFLLADGGVRGHRSKLKMHIPCPDGSLQHVDLIPHSNFAPDLAERFPQIRTYRVRSPKLNGYLSDGPAGLNGVFRLEGQEFYLDALPKHPGTVIAYYTKYVQVLPEIRQSFGSHEHFGEQDQLFIEETHRSSPFARRYQEPVNLHTYDLALACTGEYAAKHGGTVEGALDAMNVALIRINFILETELAITLRLFPDNDELIFLDPATDPYTNGSAGIMAGENNNYLAANVITSKYDLGHVFGTDCGNIVGTSGGVGTVCGTNKGFGSSCEIVSNDRFYIGIVCHELGHQFGAEHTWNNCPNAPDNQFSAANAFEPGSGTTIMSYAGACGDQNIAFSEDFYYHNNSLTAIRFFVENGGRSCAEITPLENNPPVVTANHSDGFTIPIRTAFRLSAEGSDPDGDTISYCWEQYDAGIGAASMSPIAEPAGNGPIFRSIEPSVSPTRIVPSLAKVLAGNFDDSEVLPTYSRDLTFRVTARDNQMGGGAFSWDEVKFKATETAGPFILTSFFRRDTIRRGDFVTVEWDVANTDQAPVDCRTVNIKMSVDAGNTFPYDLALDVDNDGHEQVLIPDTLTHLVRFMVEAADNIFFDINEARMIIAEARNPGIAWDVYPHRAAVCVPGPVRFEARSFGLLDFSSSGELVVMEAPDDVTLELPEAIHAGDTLELTAVYGPNARLGVDTISIGLVANGDTTLRQVLVEAVLNDFSDQQLLGPQDGQSGLSLRPEFEWVPSQYADSYSIEVAKSPDFNQGEMTTGLSNRYSAATLLDPSTVYYWRIRPENTCGPGQPSEVRAFQTVTQACTQDSPSDLPVNISQSQMPTLRSVISITESGTVSDVNILNLEGFHEAFGDLTVKLISPSGTSATLFSGQCGFSNRQFKLSFDDDATAGMSCQVNFSNAQFKPRDSLAVFDGEPIEGDWILEVSDSAVGSGGRIDAWSIELCGSISSMPPDFMHDTLHAEVGKETPITNTNLSAVTSTTSSDLVYTLVTPPQDGQLFLAGSALAVGNQFSQEDVDQSKVSYQHQGTTIGLDSISFTIVDVSGGWVPISSLPIKVVESSTRARWATLEHLWRIEPNPTADMARIKTPPTLDVLEIVILDVTGHRVVQFAPPAKGANFFNVDVASQPPGIYFVHIRTSGGSGTKRLVVQH